MVKMFKSAFDLPCEVLERVLCMFLDITSVGRLDSALCNREGRENFVTILASVPVAFSLNCDLINNIPRCIQWCMLRKIKLYRVIRTRIRSYNTGMVQSQLAKVFQASAAVLREVRSNDSTFLRALAGIDGKYASLRVIEWESGVSPVSFSDFLAKIDSCLCDLRLRGTAGMMHQEPPLLFRGSCLKVKSVVIRFDFLPNTMVDFENCFPNLQELEIFGWRSNLPVPQLPHFPNLQKLVLFNLNTLTDAAVAEIAGVCPHLTTVELCKCAHITWRAVVAISTHCTQLQALDLSHIPKILSVEAAASIGESLASSLTKLGVRYCGGASSAAVRALQRCTRLEVLDFSGLQVLLPSQLCELFTACTALCNVNLEIVAVVNDEVLQRLVTSCPRLRKLTISGCSRITDTGVLYLAEHATALTELTVAYTDSMFSSLAITTMKRLYPKLHINRETLVDYSDSDDDE